MKKTNLLSWLYFSHPKKADIVNILIIIAIWTVMVIVVNPLGDFPLNDDWVYRFLRKVISAFPVQPMLTYFFKPFGEPYFAFLLDFHLLHYASQL
jgi:hypothetical protein